MPRRVRYHTLFDCDVLQAADWYDSRSKGLGETFITNVRAATDTIIADPERFGRTPTGLRFARVKRFPYVVLFDLTESELLLTGVLHTARSFEKWRQERG